MFFFVFNDTATTEIYTYGHTLSLHDARPILDAGTLATPTHASHARRGRSLERRLPRRYDQHCHLRDPLPRRRDRAPPRRPVADQVHTEGRTGGTGRRGRPARYPLARRLAADALDAGREGERKSTRPNSSHECANRH